jgi:hypothetical protein
LCLLGELAVLLVHVREILQQGVDAVLPVGFLILRI